MIMNLLKDVNNWSFLTNTNVYKKNKEKIPKYYYDTIIIKFNL